MVSKPEYDIPDGHVLITAKDNATYDRLVALLLDEDHEPAMSLLDADDILKQVISERDSLRTALEVAQSKVMELEDATVRLLYRGYAVRNP